jgi:glycosyltransferase involved in cell wall biosynthesis
MKNKLFIIIPAYNEEKTIGKLLEKLKKKNYKNIIVVNDCSKDKTSEIAEKSGAIVLNHIINRGLGGALRTGFEYAIQEKADVALTMDADLQHKVEEIPNVIKPVMDGKADVVIGVRTKDLHKMPASHKLANKIGNLVTFVFFGSKVNDSQSGFRVFSLKALKKINLYTNQMEISSEIIGEIKKNKLKLVEIPISTLYTKYSLSKGQNFKQGIKTLLRLIAVRLR